MHSHDLHVEGTDSDITYHHNGDFSGDVRFYYQVQTDDSTSEEVMVEIPFEHMKTLVAYWVLGEKVSKLEECENVDDILFGRV